MSITELTALVTEMQDMKRIADEAKAAAEALSERIKTALGDVETMVAGPYKLTYKPVTRTTIDSKRLTADHPDIAAAYSNTTTTRPLRIN